jgi:hypothetical protein
MIDTESLPSPAALPEYHADFLELTALRSSSRRVSIHEYIRDLRLANADETLSDDEPAENATAEKGSAETLAESAFNEVDDRKVACGKNYPFEITGHSVRLHHDAEASVYAFLALLSWFGKDAGPPKSNGEKLFEEICAIAAAAYLGGTPHVRSTVFGFPRRVEPRGFKAALDALCEQMGEG